MEIKKEKSSMPPLWKKERIKFKTNINAQGKANGRHWRALKERIMGSQPKGPKVFKAQHFEQDLEANSEYRCYGPSMVGPE